MSERIQQNAKARANAAQKRERKARQRARANEKRGNRRLADLHRRSAELQADAEANADTLLELDQELEGDRLRD